MNNQYQPPIRNFLTLPVRCVILLLALFAGMLLAQAAQFGKADNTTALNVAGSWTNNAVPGASDIAQWDNIVTAPNTTNALGGNLSWSGIKIIDPGSAVQISAGSTLTIGAGGIDMAAATQDLVFSNVVIVGPAYQKWTVPNGRTLNWLQYSNKPGIGSASEGVVEFSTTGTMLLTNATQALVIDSQGNPWATYGQNDWPALSAGQVIAATYTAVGAAGLSAAAGANADVTADVPGGANSATDVASLRFNDPTPRALSIANSATARTATIRGVLVTPNCGGATINGSVATSFIRPSRGSTAAATSYRFIQNSTIGDLTVSAKITDASSGAPVKLVKSGPGKMILANTNSYTGGTVVHQGILQVNYTTNLGGSIGSGAVLVNKGSFAAQNGSFLFVPSITFASGTTNTIITTSANGQCVANASYTNLGSLKLQFSYNAGVPFSATTAPLLIASNLTVSGAVSVDVLSGSPAIGQFPLLKWTNAIAGGTFANFSLGTMPLRTLGYLSNNTANFSIDLVVTNITEPLKWAAGNGTWNIATTPNWADSLGTVTTYQEANGSSDTVVFEDALSVGNPITVTLNSVVSPNSTMVNAAKNYTISGSGSISGAASLTKSGAGTLTLASANSFSGGLYLSNGIVNFSTLTNLGGGGINFVGGTLQYASGNVDDISVRTVSFGPGGGTIDTGGNAVTLANPVGNSGAGGLTKTGANNLTLNGTNRYSGATIVQQGNLVLGSATAFISNSVSITVSSGAVLDVTAKPTLTLNGLIGQALAGAGTVLGNLICPTGAAISPGAGPGTLTMNDLIMAGGTNVMDINSSPALSDKIVATNLTLTSGTIQLVASSALPSGTYKLIQYSGTLSGSAGLLNLVLTGTAQPNKALTLSDATTGEIDLIVADSVSTVMTWSGATDANWNTTGTQNWLAGGIPWAYTNGAFVTFDEVGIAAQNTVQLQSGLLPSSVTVSNSSAIYTFADGTGTGGGKISGPTKLVKKGSNTLIIQTDNNNTGSTDIQNGTVQVGNGGIGDIGTGNITNNGALVFQQNANRQVNGVISGAGPLTQQGSATLTLAASNTYAGSTTIGSGATLQVGTGGAAGSLGSGAVTNDGTLIYNKTGSFAVGSIKTGPANGGALTFNGAATVTLNNGNTYINNTTINNGVVKLAVADAIPSGATVPGSTGWLVLDGSATAAGTLDINNLNISVNALSGLGNTFNGVITNTGASSTTTNLITVLGTVGTTYNGAINDGTGTSKIGLTLLGENELRLNGNCNFSGQTLVASGATLGVGPGFVNGPGLTVVSNNATLLLHNNGSTSFSWSGSLFIPDNSVGIIRSTSTANTMGNAATVSGGATATNIVSGTGSPGQNVSFNAPAAKQFQSFLGTVLVTNGQTIRFSSTTLSVNGGDNTTFDVEAGGFISTRNGSGATAGNGIYLGALTGAGTLSGGGVSNSTVTTYIIGGKGVDSTFSGSIVNGSQGNTAIVKVGAGTLTLNGATNSVVTSPDGGLTFETNIVYTSALLTYSGATTISNGVLKIVVPAVLTNSLTPVTLASATAVLDASQMGYIATDNTTFTNLATNGVFEVVSGQTLAGIGTIRATSVKLDSGSTFNVGLPYGSLTATNNVELAGLVNMSVNATNTVKSSTLVAQNFTVDGTASLVVTNRGPENYAVFQLFNHPINIPSVTLPTLTGTNIWANNLTVDGSITLVAPPLVNTTPTNMTATVSGNTLTLAWPADHTGWHLQIQTNTLSVGLVTNTANWVTLPGSELVNSTNMTINPANGTVFYRMVYP